MADLRILQANERTFLAWSRTGVALVVFGFALARVAVWLEPMSPASTNDGPLVALGVLLVIAGSLLPAFAALRHARIRAAILRDEPITPSAFPTYVLGGLLAAVGLALALWLALS
jgi:putative membrane protein